MIALPKDLRAANFCREWAKDFAAEQADEHADYWNALANGFRDGASINPDALEGLREEVAKKVNANTQVLAYSSRFAPEDVLAAMEIRAEALYIRSVLAPL